MSPERREALETCSRAASRLSLFKRIAMVSPFALRSVSACALPRPSAMASAKLANRTVNQSQSVICRLKPKPGRLCTMLSMSSAVVRTLPTSTTNITGFLTIQRGSSLRTESSRACVTICVFQRFVLCAMSVCLASSVRNRLEKLSRLEHQVLQDRSKAQRREKGKGAQNQDHADQQRSEQARVHREGPRRGRDALLRGQA